MSDNLSRKIRINVIFASIDAIIALVAIAVVGCLVLIDNDFESYIVVALIFQSIVATIASVLRFTSAMRAIQIKNP